MGLRGPGARAPKGKPARTRRRSATLPWRRKGLSRPEKVIAFLEWLPVTKGVLAGKRMKLLPGQVRFVRKLYGDLDEDGRRRVRLAVKSEPRGGGKTGLAAGLALCHLLGPESEARGEVYSAAVDKLQATLIYKEMKAIIDAVPEFAERTNIVRYYKVIEVMSGDGAGSIYESLSADERRAHGLSPSLWIYDEYGVARSSELFDNLLTAQGKRAEGLGVVISTQAVTDEHPLSQLIDDGLLGVDPSVYVQLACAPDDADIFAEATWFACNEALGHFLDEKEFRAQARRAKRLPSFRVKFQNLRLNMRVDADARYISDQDWMKCADAVSRKALAGELC